MLILKHEQKTNKEVMIILIIVIIIIKITVVAYKK
jgi:predicted nucleic acid-binding Zn ribbon protein